MPTIAEPLDEVDELLLGLQVAFDAFRFAQVALPRYADGAVDAVDQYHRAQAAGKTLAPSKAKVALTAEAIEEAANRYHDRKERLRRHLDAVEAEMDRGVERILGIARARIDTVR